MRNLILGLILLLGVPPAVHSQVTPLQTAVKDLYLVACQGPNEEAPTVYGSAFPVAPEIVMTARHIECPDGQKTMLSEDFGATFFEIVEKDNYPHGHYDVRVYIDHREHKLATFRKATLGEHTLAFGAAFGSDGFATDAHVMRVDQQWLVTDALPIGGMSGSAIFGEDGAILGMTVQSLTDSRHNATINMGVEGSLLGVLLKDFMENVQYK